MSSHPDDARRDHPSIVRRLQGEASGPRALVVHPTDVCNHACSFCWYERSADHIRLDDYRRFIGEHDYLRGVEEVIVAGGGEPLMHPDIDAIITATRETFPTAHLRLLTNGSLLHRIDRSVLAQLDYVRVSLDATNHVEYAAIHGVNQGVFARVLANIESLARVSTTTLGVSFVETKMFEASEFTRLVADLHQCGVKHVLRKPFVDKSLIRDGQVASSDVAFVYDRASHVNQQPGLDLPSAIADLVLHIAADGHVYPCSHKEGRSDWRIAHLTVDSISNATGADVWARHARNPHPCRIFDAWDSYWSDEQRPVTLIGELVDTVRSPSTTTESANTTSPTTVKDVH